MKIFKWPLEDADSVLEMQQGATPLSVGVQNGIVMLWCMVEPTANIVRRRFRIHGTGWNIDGGGKFVGTVQTGAFVWHIFDHGEVVD